MEATNQTVIALDSATLAWIGGAVVTLVGFVLKWVTDRQTKIIDNRLAQRDRDEAQYRRELEEERIHEMKGQQITCDCLHELIYAVLNGEHNGGLEQVSQELETYRKENNELIMKKAARYNLNASK